MIADRSDYLEGQIGKDVGDAVAISLEERVG